MATYDLEEQEQISELKAWWNQYGNLITVLVTVAALAVVGWQVWNWYQRSQAAQASALYATIQKAVAERDTKRARDASGELLEKYARTVYAGLGALMSARLQYESGDIKTAKAQLAWAVGNAADDELRDVARLRLAAVLLDEKAYDEALQVLEKPPLAPFAARFHELRGDVLTAQGKGVPARAAYEAALAAIGAGPDGVTRESSGLGVVLQTKLDAAGALP